MNDDLPIQKLFHPFRDAKAPEGFTDKVMAHILSESSPRRSPMHFRRWVWTAGLALAASVILMVTHTRAPSSESNMDLSIYLADTNAVEEDGSLGTEIESYFL
jgi:hypothetical protein